MAATEAKPEPEFDAGHVPMTEELDDAKHNLPPLVPVLIAMAIVGVIVAVAALGLKHPVASTGSIGEIYAVDVASQNSVLCSIQISVQNKLEKPIFVHGVNVTIHTPDKGDLTDSAASAGDFSRYFAAFPDLQSHTSQPLRPETKIEPGQTVLGSVIVVFQGNKASFDARKGLTATVDIYDHDPLVLNK